MAKTVKFTEVLHQWNGIAIVREEGQLKEIPLGVVHTEKKLKETGAKDLFKELGLIPESAIAVEVSKLADISTTYEADAEKFKEIAEAVFSAENELNGEEGQE